MKEVMRGLVFATILLFLHVQNAKTEDELDTSPEVLNYSFELFSDAAFGYDPDEAAGWILQSQIGYSLHKWPKSKEKSVQRFNGLPVAAVALLHTHPTKDIQKPSDQDVSIAREIKIPVYTICRAGIWKINPDGVIVKIQPLNWFKEMKAKKKAEENSKIVWDEEEESDD
jgi:hypothetical protein